MPRGCRGGPSHVSPANLLERRLGEVRKRPLLSTRANRGKVQGWAQGTPTSASGKEKEPLAR